MCNICRQTTCHPRCPNYIPPKVTYYCSSCGEGIYNGEEYIENDNGEYKHLDCIYGISDLLEWLGSEVKIMEENNG